MSFSQKSELNPITWNALFWIILLFTSVNAIAKSFQQEKEARHYYYYTIASPESIIISKIIYNAMLMLGLGFLGYATYSLVMGNPVGDPWFFLINLILGCIGFSVSLTLVAGIASKADNNGALMAVFSFPIIIPMLLVIIKISKNSIDGLDREISYEPMFVLLAINLIAAALSYLLFPYLWRS